MKFVLAFLTITLFAHGEQKVEYSFYNDPIDVVIPCGRKDVGTLNLCIQHVKKNVKNVRRVVIVSAHPYTTEAEWFDENLYPFSRLDLGFHIFHGDPKKVEEFLSSCLRVGWIYQQFLKLYAPFVIPGISSNVLIVDADVMFLRPIEFLTESGGGLYNPGSEYHKSYFAQMNRLLPGLKKVYLEYSGISHHMLFQKSVLEDLFAKIEAYHGVPCWQALSQSIDPAEVHDTCLSEYEIYFNFLFSRTDQAKIRPLKWGNEAGISPQKMAAHIQRGFDYVAYHK